MTVQAREAPAPPVGVIESLARGFETVSSRLGLILIPLALDLFLWTGPRLSIEALVQRVAALLNDTPGIEPGSAGAQNLQALAGLLSDFGRQFNLFSMLSTAPLGLPSLMAARAPFAAPTGAVTVVQVANPLLYLLILGAFILIGLLLGALYMAAIARQLREEPPGLAVWASQLVGQWARFLVMTLLVAVVGVGAGLPLMALTAVIGAFSPALAQVALIGALAVAMWAFLYLAFTPHGVVLGEQGVFAALWDSIRMVQWNLPATLGLFTLMAAISWGLNYVWNLPKDDSWYLLIGVAGHAYISTALLTASFIFYKDRHRWWKEARAQLVARLKREQRQAGQQK